MPDFPNADAPPYAAPVLAAHRGGRAAGAAGGPDATQPRPLPLVSGAALAALQQQLGGAVRVLRIDASSHPALVRSFHAAELPCFVLVHYGIELWRQGGLLPDAATIAALLPAPPAPIPETTPQT